jgi:2-keto-4-pentenoate hydratase/2-oxohepta-3-ene-1,7-dioic acid hydratase in catechol pathway
MRLRQRIVLTLAAVAVILAIPAAYGALKLYQVTSIARDLQVRDGDCARAKAFDTFCPIGPCIDTDLDPRAATLETWVNGTRRAPASTAAVLLAVEEALARVSEVMTLLPGDVVATGAPSTSWPVDAGDRVEIRIDGVGALKNTVVRL